MSFTQTEDRDGTQLYFSYDGLLHVPALGGKAAEEATVAAQDRGLPLQVGPDSIEFQFAGRDSRRSVIEFLRELAHIIGHASGEIRCEISNEGADSRFEFFKVTGHHLVRQQGFVVRGPEEVL